MCISADINTVLAQNWLSNCNATSWEVISVNTRITTTTTIDDGALQPLPPSKYEIIEGYITTTILIDLSTFPQPTRDDTTTINLYIDSKPKHQWTDGNLDYKTMVIL